ncbi:helix-turn-helix domain-containing protein [Carboxylicivirga marina]|uniref:Helix-turn-helix transcriptional regulator n=1 Tax=Carboxylicivirga marina TaxID=2800988 RepID=A0ABS1HPV1_9BACT|nr:helix-turn-helix transcriptional regulator [Carboxylicivirga marina]MBK3519714.1 helix-turn-helix transcriptional regulator [Carboxylicivirga marina]
MLRIKEILKQNEMTGKELAEKVSVTASTITNIVQGRNFPKPELLKDIARVLDVDIRELFISTKDTAKETIYINRNGEYLAIGEMDVDKIGSLN